MFVLLVELISLIIFESLLLPPKFFVEFEAFIKKFPVEFEFSEKIEEFVKLDEVSLFWETA